MSNNNFFDEVIGYIKDMKKEEIKVSIIFHLKSSKEISIELEDIDIEALNKDFLFLINDNNSLFEKSYIVKSSEVEYLEFIKRENFI